MRRVLFPVIIGLGGAAILFGLGIWQVQRLAWKEGVIAEIEARMNAAPVALPADISAQNDKYLPVAVAGPWGGAETLRVLVSQKDVGAGYRLISVLDTPDGRIMVDRGFVPVALIERGFSLNPVVPVPETDAAAQQPVIVEGVLHWPEEVDSFTPAPDVAGNIWFARDVPAMAKALKAREVLLVASKITPSAPEITPLPVDTSRIPNNHLQYAVTWFSLGALWLAMTLFFVLRGRSGQN